MGLAQGTELRNDTRRSRASYPDRSPARCLGGLFCSLAQRASFCGVDQPGPWHDLCRWSKPWSPTGASDCRSLACDPQFGRSARESSGATSRRSETRVDSQREEHQVTTVLDQQPLAHLTVRSQAEQLRQARRERRLATFTRVHELSAQGWSGASIARMLGIHKKTAVKYAQAEHFPEARSDRGHKLAPYLPFLHTQWVAGAYNIASLYQAIRTQGYAGSETAVRNYLTALREEVGPRRRPRRQYPPVSKESKQHQRTGLSSRRATWLVLRRPENCSSEDQRTLDLLKQAHPQVRVACELAQAFAQMIRKRNATALEPWLEGATESAVPELRTFATGMKRDQAAILAALTYAWSQGQTEGQITRLKLIKRQAYGRAGFDLLRHRVLARSA